MTTKALSLVETINQEINKELANEGVVRALLATTFKNMTQPVMKQAIMEGMLRNFTFKDFLEKRVYALPYGGGYSLITAIDYHREIGQAGGVTGKSAPRYKDDENGNIISCAVTVYKKDGHPDGFTAEVYFKEYYKAGKPGKPTLWDTKPRTMIAKVAEAHALRMACPKELAKLYVEEEFQQEEPERTYGVPRSEGPATAKAPHTTTHVVMTNKEAKQNEKTEKRGADAENSPSGHTSSEVEEGVDDGENQE